MESDQASLHFNLQQVAGRRDSRGRSKMMRFLMAPIQARARQAGGHAHRSDVSADLDALHKGPGLDLDILQSLLLAHARRWVRLGAIRLLPALGAYRARILGARQAEGSGWHSGVQTRQPRSEEAPSVVRRPH
jgi:hypothetical protein